MPLSDKEIKALADELYIDFDFKQKDALNTCLDYWLKRFHQLDQIDLAKVNPTHYVGQMSQNALRKDIPVNATNSKDILDACECTEGDFIVVK